MPAAGNAAPETESLNHFSVTNCQDSNLLQDGQGTLEKSNLDR